MREDDRWVDEELPSPDELMPLSQTLITPDLAIAFDIRNPNQNQHQNHHHHHQVGGGGGGQQHQGVGDVGGGATPPPPSQMQSQGGNSSGAEFETVGSGGDEPARTLKRPRLVWTPQLHKRFVDAVAHLGIKNAVPKTIMQLMSVDGLTRENVASHLQKYRLYLKRMQGIHSGGGNTGAGGGSVVDSATDRLFASQPVPAHFLRPNSDHFMPPYVPVTAMQMAVPMVGHHGHGHGHPQLQQHHHQFRQFGNSPPNGGGNANGNGQFEQHPFLARQSQQVQSQRIGTSLHNNHSNALMAQSSASYVEDMESATGANGRKVLTLFPNADD